MPHRETSDPLAPLTLTHARLRAGQGDLARARRILHALLCRDPENESAMRLLERLRGHHDSGRSAARAEAIAPRRAATPGELRSRFRAALDSSAGPDPRIHRLQRWLQRIAPEDR